MILLNEILIAHSLFSVYTSVLLVVTIPYESCLHAHTIQEKYFSNIYGNTPA